MNRMKGVVAVAATYFFFLIFAQFAFLEQAKAIASSQALEAIMMAMGLSGLFSSLLTAHLLKKHDELVFLRRGFLACALTAAMSPFCSGPASILVIAVLIGLALGCLTVSLATGLLRLTGASRLGLQVGIGTGSVYFLCNVPQIFQATPNAQAWMACVACLLGFFFNLQTKVESQSLVAKNHGLASWYTPMGVAVVVTCFFALIWMDSAIFYIIQQNLDYKEATWSTSRLWLNGPIHLIFAVLAGIVIDRGYIRPLLLGGYALLAAGALALIAGGSLVNWAAPLYVAGVSLYSVALVAFPSMSDESPGKLPRRWRAGSLYGLAGWVGSAMGIGMARDLQRIPPLFILLAGLVLLLAWQAVSPRISGFIKVLGVSAVALLTGCLGYSDIPPQQARPASASAGRQVYIAEGCIHCHSQYVRPGTPDEERWGPYRDLEELRTQTPPLFGNRRQGPDLLNVGNRRSEMWQKLHLQDPRLVSPGSSMPAYGFLFQDQRGDDLVAYLQSLGADTILERSQTVRAWKPDAHVKYMPTARAARLFDQACAGCHDNGPAARLLDRPVRDLVSDPFLFVLEGQPNSDLELARIIKFGIPGTNMPGHESFSDEEISGLRTYVQQRRQAGKP